MQNMLVNKGLFEVFDLLNERHYQWSALPLSYSSTVGNSLTESIHAPQPQFGYPATIGRNRHHLAGAGGETAGNLFAPRSGASFTIGYYTPWATMGGSTA